MTTQVWDRDTVNALLLSNAKACECALVELHNRQTASEQSRGATTDSNGVGFGHHDAAFFSSLSLWVKRGRSLSAKQLAVVQKKNVHGIARLAKYWSQIGETLQKNFNMPAQQAQQAQVQGRIDGLDGDW